MSATLDAIIAGANDPVIVQFENQERDSNDDPAPFDASGATVSLVLRGADGELVDTAGKVAWTDDDVSKAQFNRLAGDLTAENSPYRARWYVTVGGITYPYPEASSPDLWLVVDPA